MALMIFPSGNSHDVPDEEVQQVSEEYGAYVDTGSPVLAFRFPSGATHLVNPSDVPEVISKYGGRQVTNGHVDLAMPDTSIKQVDVSSLSDYAVDGGIALKPSMTLADVDKSRKGDKTPVLWFGRPLNKPIDQIAGGDEYLRYAERASKGRAGFWESITPGMEDIPFAGGVVSTVDLISVNKIAEKVGAGDELTDEELVKLNNFLIQQDREASAGIPGMVGSIVRQSVVFGAELGATIASAGALASLLTGSVGAKAGAKVGEKAARKQIIRYIKKRVRDAVTKSVGKRLIKEGTTNAFKQGVATYTGKVAGGLASAAAAGAINTVTQQAIQGVASVALGEGVTSAAAQRRLIYSNLDGKSESEVHAYLMGTLESWIEGASEYSGDSLKGAGKAIGKALLPEQWAAIVSAKLAPLKAAARGKGVVARYLDNFPKFAGRVKALQTLWAEKGLSSVTAEKIMEFTKYDGVLEEWGEERVAGFLNGLFGTQGDEAGLRSAWEQMWPDTQQGIAEVIAFSVPGMYVQGMKKVEAAVAGQSLNSLSSRVNTVIAALRPKPRLFEQDTGKVLREGEYFDTEEGNEVISSGTDAIAMAADTKDTFANKALNLAFDILTVPFTLDFARIQYGSMDRALEANGLPPLVQQFQAIRDGIGGDPAEAAEAAKPAMRNLIKYGIRRTMDLSGDEAFDKRLQELEDSGVFTREEAGVVAIVNEALLREKDMLDYLKSQGVKLRLAPGTHFENRDTLEASKDATYRDMIDPSKPLADRLAAAVRIGLVRTGPAATGLLSLGAEKYLNMRTSTFRSLIEHFENPGVKLGFEVTHRDDAAKRRYRIIELDTHRGKARLLSSDTAKAPEVIEVDIDSIGVPDKGGEAKLWRVQPNDLVFSDMAVTEVVGTLEEFEPYRDKIGYGDNYREYLADTGRTNKAGDKLFRFTPGAANQRGVILVDLTKGPYHALEDTTEALMPSSVADIPGAVAFLEKLRAYVKQQIKESSDPARAIRLQEFHQTLNKPSAMRELLLKVILQKLAGFDKARYGALEELPFHDAIAELPDDLSFATTPTGSGFQEAHNIVAQFLGANWHSRFAGPWKSANIQQEISDALTGQRHSGLPRKGKVVQGEESKDKKKREASQEDDGSDEVDEILQERQRKSGPSDQEEVDEAEQILRQIREDQEDEDEDEDDDDDEAEAILRQAREDQEEDEDDDAEEVLMRQKGGQDQKSAPEAPPESPYPLLSVEERRALEAQAEARIDAMEEGPAKEAARKSLATIKRNMQLTRREIEDAETLGDRLREQSVLFDWENDLREAAGVAPIQLEVPEMTAEQKAYEARRVADTKRREAVLESSPYIETKTPHAKYVGQARQDFLAGNDRQQFGTSTAKIAKAVGKEEATAYWNEYERLTMEEYMLQIHEGEAPADQAPAAPVQPEAQTINIYAGTNENADLSNFAERPFEFRNLNARVFTSKLQKFRSVEHAFQFAKIAGFYKTNVKDAAMAAADRKAALKQLEGTTAAQARAIGRKFRLDRFELARWEEGNEALMKELLTASFEQNPDALKRLLATGNATLTHTQDKSKWGEAFPRLLMEVRDELRNKAPAAAPVQEQAPVEDAVSKEEAKRIKRREYQRAYRARKKAEKAQAAAEAEQAKADAEAASKEPSVDADAADPSGVEDIDPNALPDTPRESSNTLSRLRNKARGGKGGPPGASYSVAKEQLPRDFAEGPRDAGSIDPNDRLMLAAVKELLPPSNEDEESRVSRVLKAFGIPRRAFDTFVESVDPAVLAEIQEQVDLELEEMKPERQDTNVEVDSEEVAAKRRELVAEFGELLSPFGARLTEPRVQSQEALAKVVSGGDLHSLSASYKRKDLKLETAEDLDPSSNDHEEAEGVVDPLDLSGMSDSTMASVGFSEHDKLKAHLNAKTGVLSEFLDRVYGLEGYGHHALHQFFSNPSWMERILEVTESEEAYEAWLEEPSNTATAFWLKSFFTYAKNTHGLSRYMLLGTAISFDIMTPLAVEKMTVSSPRSYAAPAVGNWTESLRQQYKAQVIMSKISPDAPNDDPVKWNILRNVSFNPVPGGEGLVEGTAATFTQAAMFDASDSVLIGPDVNRETGEVVEPEPAGMAVDLLGVAHPGAARPYVRLTTAPLMDNGTPTPAFKRLQAKMDELASHEDFEYFVAQDNPGYDEWVIRYAASQGYKVKSFFSAKGKRSYVKNNSPMLARLSERVDGHYGALSEEAVAEVVRVVGEELLATDKLPPEDRVAARVAAMQKALQALSGIDGRAWVSLGKETLLGTRGSQPNAIVGARRFTGLDSISTESTEGLGMVGPFTQAGEFLRRGVRDNNYELASNNKLLLGKLLFFDATGFSSRDARRGFTVSSGRSNLAVLAERSVGAAPELSPVADFGVVNGRKITVPGIRLRSAAADAVLDWLKSVDKDLANSADAIIALGTIQVGGKPPRLFSDLEVEERDQVRRDKWRQGYLYLGSFSDKSAALFVRIPKRTAVATYEWYQDFYKKAAKAEVFETDKDGNVVVKTKDLRGSLVKTPDLSKEELSVRAGNAFFVDHKFWTPIYLAKMNHLIDGDISAYDTPKAALVDTFLKRRASDISGGPTYKYVERYLKRPITSLIIADEAISKRMNGQVVYRREIARALYESMGPMFSNDVIEDDDGNPIVYSSKYHMKYVDADGRPEYWKHNAVLIDLTLGNGDPLMEYLYEIMELLDVDFIQFGPDNIKVTSPEARKNWVNLFDVADNVVTLRHQTMEATIEAARGHIVPMVADGMYITTDLSRKLTNESAGNLAKQARLNSTIMGTTGVQMQQIFSAQLTESLFPLAFSDPNWVIDRVLMNFSSPAHQQHGLYEDVVKTGLSLSDPRVASRVSQANISFLAKRTRLKVARHIRQLINGFSNKVSSYTLVDAAGNTVTDPKEAEYMQLPEDVVTTTPTVVPTGDPDADAAAIKKLKGAYIRVQTYGAGADKDELAEYVARHSATYLDMFKVATEEVSAVDDKGVPVYLAFAYRDGKPVVPVGAPLVSLRYDTALDKYVATSETVDRNSFRRVKDAEEREINGGHEWYIPGSIGRSIRVPTDGLNASHIIRYVAAEYPLGNMAVKNDTVVQAYGADQDGDTIFYDNQEGSRFDFSTTGRMNRSLYIEAQERTDPAYFRVSTRSLDDVTGEFKAAMQAVRDLKAAEREIRPTNDPLTALEAVDLNQMGKKEILPIAAKTNPITALTMTLTPVVTKFYLDYEGYEHGSLWFNIGSEEFTIGRSEEVAAFLRLPENKALRTMMQERTSGLMVSTSVDDEKNPTLKLANVSKITMPYITEMLRFNDSLIPAPSVPPEDRAEYFRERAVKFTDDLVKSMANDKSHLGLYAKLKGMEENKKTSSFKVWLKVALELEATPEQREAYEGLTGRIREARDKEDIRGLHKQLMELIYIIMDPSVSQAARYVQVGELSDDMFMVGKVIDTYLGEKLPRSVGGFFEQASVVESVLMDRLAHLIIDIPPFVRDTVNLVVARTGQAFQHIPAANRLLGPLMEAFPEGLVKGTLFTAAADNLQRALYAEAVNRLEGGVTRADGSPLLSSESPVPIFVKDGLLSPERGIKRESLIRKYLGLHVDRGVAVLRMASLGDLGTMTEAEKAALKVEFAALDRDTIVDLYKLDAASFGVFAGPKTGSFKDFLSSPGNSEVSKEISDNVEALIQEWQQEIPGASSLWNAVYTSPYTYAYEERPTHVSTRFTRRARETSDEDDMDISDEDLDFMIGQAMGEESEEEDDDDDVDAILMSQATEKEKEDAAIKKTTAIPPELNAMSNRERMSPTQFGLDKAVRIATSVYTRTMSASDFSDYGSEFIEFRDPSLSRATRLVQEMVEVADKFAPDADGKTFIHERRGPNNTRKRGTHPVVQLRYPASFVGTFSKKQVDRKNKTVGAWPDLKAVGFDWGGLTKLLEMAVKATEDPNLFNGMYLSDAIRLALRISFPGRTHLMTDPGAREQLKERAAVGEGALAQKRAQEAMLSRPVSLPSSGKALKGFDELPSYSVSMPASLKGRNALREARTIRSSYIKSKDEVAQQLASFMTDQGWEVGEAAAENSVADLFAVASYMLVSPGEDPARFMKDASNALAYMLQPTLFPGTPATDESIAGIQQEILAYAEKRAETGYLRPANRSRLRKMIDKIVEFFRNLFTTEAPIKRIALEKYVDEILEEGFSSVIARTPPAGHFRLEAADLMNANELVGSVIETMSQESAKLTGSVAYALQGVPVYKKDYSTGFDLDYVVGSVEASDNIERNLGTKFPGTSEFYRFRSDTNGANVVGLIVPPPGHKIQNVYSEGRRVGNRQSFKYRRGYTVLTNAGGYVGSYEYKKLDDGTVTESYDGPAAMQPVVVDLLSMPFQYSIPGYTAEAAGIKITTQLYPIGTMAKLEMGRAKDLAKDYPLASAPSNEEVRRLIRATLDLSTLAKSAGEQKLKEEIKAAAAGYMAAFTPDNSIFRLVPPRVWHGWRQKFNIDYDPAAVTRSGYYLASVLGLYNSRAAELFINNAPELMVSDEPLGDIDPPDFSKLLTLSTVAVTANLEKPDVMANNLALFVDPQSSDEILFASSHDVYSGMTRGEGEVEAKVPSVSGSTRVTTSIQDALDRMVNGGEFGVVSNKDNTLIRWVDSNKDDHPVREEFRDDVKARYGISDAQFDKLVAWSIKVDADSKAFRSLGLPEIETAAATPVTDAPSYSAVVRSANSFAQGVSLAIGSEAGVRSGRKVTRDIRVRMANLRTDLQPELDRLIHDETQETAVKRLQYMRDRYRMPAGLYRNLNDLITKFKLSERAELDAIDAERRKEAESEEVNPYRLSPIDAEPLAYVEERLREQDWKLEAAISPVGSDSLLGPQVLTSEEANEINYSLALLPRRAGEWALDSIFNYGAGHAHSYYIDLLAKMGELSDRETKVFNDDLVTLAIRGDRKIVDIATGKVLETLSRDEQQMLMAYPWAIGAILDHKDENGIGLVDSIFAQTVNDPSARRALIAERLADVTVTFGRPLRTEDRSPLFGAQENVVDFLDALYKSSAWEKLSKHRDAKELDWYTHVRKHHNFYREIADTFPEIIKARDSYGIPHLAGRGFDTPEHQAARDRVIKALDSIRTASPEDTLITEEELRKNFNGKIPSPTELQKKLAKDLIPNLESVYSRSTLESLTLWDYNELIRKALEEQQIALAERSMLEGGTPYNPEAEENRRALATISVLYSTGKHYKFKEWTRHELARKLPGSMADIYNNFVFEVMLPDGEIARSPIRPATLDAARLRRSYMSSLAPVVINRMMLSKTLSTFDYDGSPLAIIVPNGRGDLKSLIKEDVLRAQVEAFYKIKFPGTRVPADVDIELLISEMAKSVNLEQYDVLESPFDSISKIYVKKGDASLLMRHVVQQEKRFVVLGVDLLKFWSGIVQWSKMSSVSYSGFFVTSSVESVIAGTGMVGNVFWHPIKTLKAAQALAKELRENRPGHALATKYGDRMPSNIKHFSFMATGETLELGKEVAVDQATGTIQRQIEEVREKARLYLGEKWAKRVETALNLYAGTPLSDVYFGRAGKKVGIFPALKLWATFNAIDTVIKSWDENLTWDQLDERTQRELLRKAAPAINDAYGGQFWAKYLWATPHTRQLLNATIFAPNWTLSAWNIGGGGVLTGQLLGNMMSQENADFVFKNSMAMAFYVLFLIPNMAQLAIWLAFGAGDDDKPFSFLNEQARKGHIDITPLSRFFGYDGDPTGKRRVYVRFGKQAYEVYDGWMTEPLSQLVRKTSQPVKMVIEQVTGQSPGSDWNLEFKDQGLKGFLDSKDEGLVKSFLNSRLGYIAQKFMPMAATQFIKEPQLGVAPFLAPVSKGTSQGRATADLILLYRSLAADGNWKSFKKFPHAMVNLDGVGQQILDAADQNGYDTDIIKKTAKGVVLADLYKRFAEAMNDQDTDRMSSLADRIVRIGGSIQGLTTSQSLKKKAARQELTEEERSAIAGAFENALTSREDLEKTIAPKPKRVKAAKPAPVPGKLEINESEADLTYEEALEMKRDGNLPSSMSARQAADKSSFLASLDRKKIDWLNEEVVAPKTPGSKSPGRIVIDKKDIAQNTAKAKFLATLNGKQIKWLNQELEASTPPPRAGKRNDGVTFKGSGYLGELKLPNGGTASEYTIGVNLDGVEMDIPTLVPTLTKAEVDLMVNDIIPNRKTPPRSIIQKAVAHAKARRAQGKSVYYN